MNLKDLTRISIFFLLAATLSCGTSSTKTEAVNEIIEMPENTFTLFIGTYTRKEGHVDGKADGIYVYSFNAETGDLTRESTMEGIINPSYLTVHPGGNYVYAVSETGGEGDTISGEVVAYSFDKDALELTELNRLSSEGDYPCYVSLDNTSQYVLVANYGGSIAAYPTGEDGQLLEASAAITHQGSGPSERQAGPHAHMIRQGFSGNEIYAVDLGLDRVITYELDQATGSLAVTGQDISVSTGAGPRHMDFHPQLKTMYIVNELNSTIEVFDTDENGDYQRLQIISTLPEEEERDGACADIHVHPNGRFLYASNRGEVNSIAVYEISQDDGTLELIDHESSLGAGPRSFVIDPSGRFLLVANQDSSDIFTFRINNETGQLEAPVKTEVPTPVCLKFY